MIIKYTIDTAPRECADHDQFTDSLVEQFGADPVWYGCPRCQFDKRHALEYENRTAGVTIHRDRLMNERLLDSGIPLRFQNCSLDTWSTGSSEEKLRAWHTATGFVDAFSENFGVGRSMMLLGKVGTGKTHLATGILQQVLRNFGSQGLIGRYTTAGGIIRSVKDTFGSGAKSESQVYADLVAPHLLVIDEVGVQHGSDFERTVMFEVINGRYEQRRPTVIVSNLGMADLRQCLGDRAVDRLRDKGGLAVLFRWESARGAV